VREVTMGKKAGSRKAARTPSKGAKRAPAKRPRARAAGKPLLPVQGARQMMAGTVRLDIGPAGSARVKRVVYPPGFRWSVDMKPVSGTPLCMHAHVGYLESGAIRIEFPDGCARDYVAPAVVAIEPGHDGAVIGRAPAILIEFDFKGATAERLGLPTEHRHG